MGSLPHPERIPLCEPLNDPEVVGFDVSRDLPYDYATLLEVSECVYSTCPVVHVAAVLPLS